MADRLTKKQRSYVMSRIKGKNTAPELLMKGLLKKYHFIHQPKGILGNPDFGNKKKKIAIFVDGDFWHGWNFRARKGKLPVYWAKKIAKNIARDKKTTNLLRKNGWTVLRVWEWQLRNNKEAVERDLRKIINMKK